MPFMIPEYELGECPYCSALGVEECPSHRDEELTDSDIPVVRMSDEAKSDHWREGYWTRLSAPGYMDATSWLGPFTSREDAEEAISEAYDVCPVCGRDEHDAEFQEGTRRCTDCV